VDTSVISHRVADFLKKHPPFHAMDDGDLLTLAARGRVRFHEANDFIIWQGEPHKQYVFVIQQGTVSLWDEADGHASLRDVRGAGDMLAIERFNQAAEARHCLHSARSESDVVIYAFPVADFEDLVLKYPYARQFVEAYDTVAADYQWVKDSRAPQSMFLNDVIGRGPQPGRGPNTTIRELAGSMLATGADAIAVVDSEQRIQGVVTGEALLAWVAAGAGNADQPVAALARPSPPAVGSAATITDAVLAIAEAGADALAVTADGSSNGRLHRLVTPADIARGFGDQPIAILRGIHLATTTAELRALNHRARALALQYLTSAPSVDWLARFLSLADKQIVQRLIALTGDGPGAACWCFCGASGRAESLTRHAPQLVLVVDDDSATDMHDRFARVSDALAECDYLSRVDRAFERSSPRERRVASRAEWRTRYKDWLGDPVRNEMYLARPLFDLRPVYGPEQGNESFWRDLEATVVDGVDRDLLQVLANDCLASLPPLTFFEDAVVEESGEHMTVFRLEHSALRPLVDVGRVFGMATGKVLGTSTRERLACARRLLPEHESVFREASDTFRILLWQQARIGIGQGTDGTELPPALLSRHDRHVLKSGFRSILRLVELTGNSAWFQTA